ncbi:MAG: bifunctional adenosylcobinamide kinase/adenosylcobinamide-phosphate guanylyltransferase [Nitrospirae bacterium]|nr:bifunctional adenosylcobinamide kinase/adenosylcobinamide-phosphate guanylyltransferase [Nitrospirota bacterium]
MKMENKITFIIGGARSGKSAFALNEANKFKGQKAYIATAQALDEEMRERIEKHKQQRGGEWDAYEEPLKVADVLREIKDKYKVVIIDCLTLWLSNLMCNGKDVEKEIDSLCGSLSTVHCQLFTVSNEVGMGIVPENELARKFRDFAGILNQKVAGIADDVYLVTAGIPVKIKNAK